MYDSPSADHIVVGAHRHGRTADDCRHARLASTSGRSLNARSSIPWYLRAFDRIGGRYVTKHAHPETRASLLQRVRDPADNEAWREFFNIYRPLIYRYGRLRGLSRADADEVVQKCMTKLVDKMPQFEYSSTKGGFKFWLRT